MIIIDKLPRWATFFFLMIGAVTLNAQTSGPNDLPFDDLPPNPDMGKCYAKCRIPDRFETIQTQKMVKDEAFRFETQPATYRTVKEQVLVKEASVKMIPVAAVYETMTEKVLVKEASSQVKQIPAKYRTLTEEVLVAPARGEWVRKLKDPNCFSVDPDDCYIMCYEQIPAEYKTVSKQELVSPATTETITIPAEYRTVSKRVLKSPATVREEIVPAVYKTVDKRVLVSEASQRRIAIPAVYTTVNETRLVQKGGFTEWTEVLCAAKTSDDIVKQVQRELKREGYDPGPIDGVLGIKTQTALKSYQVDYNLPVGNLNIPTLTKMSVRY